MIESRIALLLLPPVLLLAWALVRSALGRRPTRFALNAALSLLLVAYLAAVAATGIFWVAMQELPVFDWHYLLGYCLLLLAMVHVVLNWRQVATFLRRGAPASVKSASGREFRGWVRIAGLAALIAAAGWVLFLAGGQYASERTVIYVSDPRAPAAGEGTAAVEAAPAQPAARPRVEVDGESLSLSRFYHRGSSYPARTSLPGVTWRSRPAVYKEYPGRPSVPLPLVRPEGGAGVIEAADAWRAGCVRMATSSMSLEELSLLLYHAQGVTRPGAVGSRDFRAAPSAGALYPVDVYVAASRVEGLAPGLYHHDVRGDALVCLREGSVLAELEAAAGSPHCCRHAAASLILSVTFGRTGFKYRERAYRYVCMDAGHVAFNLGLAAASRGLAAPVVARFDDAALNRLLEVEVETEAALLVIPIGRPLDAEGGTALPEPVFAPALATSAGSQAAAFTEAIHAASSFRRLPGWTRLRARGWPRPASGEPAGDALILPEPARGRDLFPVIRDRRSVRTYSELPMESEELAALLAAAQGSMEPGDPLLALSAPLELVVVVRDVRGIEPGAYRYDPTARSLSLRRAGDLGAEGRSATLDQDFCGAADALFVKSVDWSKLERPDGDRGYRYACIRAGLVGEGLYLQATALGLGVCGVGAFYDGAVAELAGFDPEREAALYVTAVGR